jgi:hypothetical protein
MIDKYDADTLLKMIIQVFVEKAGSLQAYKASIPKSHKVLKEWLDIVDKYIKPIEEVKHVLSKNIPNRVLRSALSKNPESGLHILQQFIIVVTCCEALIIEEPEDTIVYEAIMIFAREAEDFPFYYQVLRELSFMLEDYLSPGETQRTNIKSYFNNLQYYRTNPGNVNIQKLLEKKNYIYLIPESVRGRQNFEPEVNRKILYIMNIEQIGSARSSQRMKSHHERIIRLRQLFSSSNISPVNINVLNLDFLPYINDDFNNYATEILLGFGIPEKEIQEFQHFL